ncbi:hypothetical protein HanRHA438_Chr07g0313751 [Helianthus annuus]|nr:hypothetical protein HanRHA438_Chr07g0313751 [Helianthus annuus]
MPQYRSRNLCLESEPWSRLLYFMRFRVIMRSRIATMVSSCEDYGLESQPYGLESRPLSRVIKI